MIKLTDSMKKEIERIISIPTVLMCKDGLPIEYSNTVVVRKVKSRSIGPISAPLLVYTASKGGSRDSIERFSSGDYGRYLSMSNIYT